MYFNGTKCQLFLFSCFLSASLFAKDVKSINAEGLQKPLCFVENKGQVYDANFHERTDVQFKLSGNGVNLFVGDGQLHYQFKKIKMAKKAADVLTYNMDVTLVGANPHAKVTATDQLEYKEIYYLAQINPDGIVANTYKKVTYSDVYPNIDWILYVNGENVEYDFVVRPGGDPNNIRIKYDGATALSIAKDGSILAKTPMGDVSEKCPVAFETGSHKSVNAKFALQGNVVSFKTGNYSGSLTIDPYLQWNTYFGGTVEDVATCIKTDAANEVYVSGYTASSGLAFNTTPISTLAGGYDAFLVRYSTAGVMSWAIYYGGTGYDEATSCALNSGGSVYLAGNTYSPTGFSSGPIYHTTNNGSGDGFLARFTKGTGIRGWGTFIGGPGLDVINEVIGDNANTDVYVVGTTQSTSLITAGATPYQAALDGTQDGYIGKFTSTTGAIIWATYYGGSGDDNLNSGICDFAGNLYVGGHTNSIIGTLASGTAFQGSLNGGSDGYLAKFAAGGTRTWGTYYGGTGGDTINCLAIDASNNLYVTGSTSSPDLLTTPFCYQSSLNGIENAFLTKLTNAGAMTWSTYLGGEVAEQGNSVTVDLQGNIATTGTTTSTTGISSVGAYQTTFGGGSDAYIMKFNTLGQKLYGTYFGGAGMDHSNSITTDSTLTNIMICGFTNTPSGFSTAGSAQVGYGGGYCDAFVARFQRDTIVSIRQRYNDTLLCAGGTFILRDTVNFNFAPGNTFTAQLSDATGSFAAPVTIGTVVSSTFGPINCTIPAGTPAGTGYRIRIVSTNPASISADDNKDISIVSVLPFTPTANSPVCIGYTLNLHANTSFVVNSYSWAGPSAFASAVANPSIAAVAITNAGTYSLTVTHTGCPATTATVNVVVNTTFPAAPIDSASSPICQGSTLYLFTRPASASGTHSYSWTGPGGFTSSLQNPTIPGITLADAGTYSAIDTMDGCPSISTSINITIDPTDTPNIAITVSPNDTVCAGDLVHFTTTVTNGGFSPGYQWLSGSSTLIVGAVFDNYATTFFGSGVGIRCILTPGTGCHDKPYDTSNVILMTVFNNTAVVSITSTATTITSGTTVTLTGTASGPMITGYQWYVNNVAVPGATSTTLVLPSITHNDTVRLEVSSIAICASVGVSNTIVIKIPTGVENVTPSFQNIELFPNPNNGNFSVKGSISGTQDGALAMDVTNAIGQVVYTTTSNITNGIIDQSLDLKNLPAGMYLLRISKDGERQVLKFMRE